MNISDEAIQAAAKAVWREWTADPEWVARAALEAAAPLLMAQAWEEGQRVTETAWTHAYDGHPVQPGEMCDECVTKNPYRKAASHD